MEFDWSAEQVRRRGEIVEFAKARLGADLIRRDADQSFDQAGWAAMADFGLTGLGVAEAYGGDGADPMTAAFLLEGLGHACADNGLLLALGAHLWGCAKAIELAGDEDQKRRWLPRLCRSEIGALAVTEAEAGSDIARISTTARRAGDGYVIHGRKTLTTNAPLADIFVVLASVEGAPAGSALSFFVLERGTPGLRPGPNQPKMGARTAALGEIELDACAAPAAHRLGPEGAGLGVFSRAMEFERNLILAPAVGTMQRLLDRSATQARERRQFGSAIGQFEHVSGMLVEMHASLEASRALLYRAAWLKAKGRPSAHASALAKLQISESWVRACEQALRIHGGRGYLVEAELERELRDAIGSRSYSGTSEVLKMLIARHLLVR